MDAIGADQCVSFRFECAAAITALEAGNHTVTTVGKRDKTTARLQRIVT
jgi:hypothetical protein